MTRIARETAAKPAPVVVRRVAMPARCPAAEIVLTWSIGRAAARACGMVADVPGPAVRLELSMAAPFAASAVRIEARIFDGDRVIPLAMPHAHGQWIQDAIAGVWHLDIEGLLKLTIRETSERIEALYARTELLAQAGIAGGRYEFGGASLKRSDG